MRLILLLIIILMLSTSISFAQNTGIGTLSPTAKLDVNGNLRVRSIPSTTDATLYNTLLSDVSGNVLNVKTLDFIDSLKVPTNVFNAQQTPDIPTNLAGSDVYNRVVFSTINLIKTTVGTWNATTNVFTVAKKGIYHIVAGVRLTNAISTSYGMRINAGTNTMTAGGVTLGGSLYAMNGTYVMLLNPNDTINIETYTSSSSTYRQGRAFLNIIFTPI